MKPFCIILYYLNHTIKNVKKKLSPEEGPPEIETKTASFEAVFV